MAVGQAIVVITRNVDLSVGSILGLSAFATGSLFLAAPGHADPGALLLGTLLGAVCGAGQRHLIAAARVPALVVTLGTLYVFRGIDYSWATGKQINAADMPACSCGWAGGGARRPGPDPLRGRGRARRAASTCVRTAAGRELYAIGSDPDAARLSGISAGRRVFAAFVTSGALAGLAGVLYAARFGTLDANVGISSELNVVAAVVVGGVAIFGGSGSVYGAALGAVLLTTIGAALPSLGVNPFWQRAAVGALLLAAIGLDRALGCAGRKPSQGKEAPVALTRTPPPASAVGCLASLRLLGRRRHSRASSRSCSSGA